MTAETRWTLCILCDGVGQVYDHEIYNLEGYVPCPDCDGDGGREP